VSETIALLWDIEYRSIPHIESGTMITPENASVAIEGHVFCRAVAERAALS
jgi:hypothetical protein